MQKTDPYETELLAAYDKASLKSVATKSELFRFKAAARATAIKGGLAQREGPSKVAIPQPESPPPPPRPPQ